MEAGIKTGIRGAYAQPFVADYVIRQFEAIEAFSAPGKTFYVSSVNGVAGNSGSKSSPVATLAQAYALATANNGDVIYVLPGHAETWAAATQLALAKAGLTIIGLGRGSLKPTITLGTDTTCHLNIDAANIHLRNFNFIGDVDSLVTFLDVNEGNFTCEDCDFTTSSTKEALCFVDLATTKDEFTFRRCRFFQPTDPGGTDGGAGTGCFYFVDSEGIYVEDCFFYGNFETAIFHNKTTAAKNVWLRNCYGTQLLAAAEIMLHVTAMEGGAINSTFNVRNAADVTDTTVWSGTMSNNFVIDVNSGVLADGAAGGQLAAPGSAANS